MKRSKIWVYAVFLLAAISLSGCASSKSYAYLRDEIAPAVKDVVIPALPTLAVLGVQDLLSLLGFGVKQVEGVVGYSGPSDTVPPQ